MSNRRLTILGTACQVPTKERNHNGYFVRWDNEGFLFDPGDGTQRQMTQYGVSASQITRIFISHFHGDHCLGLPGVLQRFCLDKVTHPVEIYFPASGLELYRSIKQFSIYRGGFEPIEHPISEPGVIFENDRLRIEAAQLDHTTDSWGYRFEEKTQYTINPEKLRSLGVQGKEIRQLKETGSITVEDRVITLEEVATPKPTQSMAYILDSRYCETALNLSKNADLLLCEATFLDAEKETAEKWGHMTTTQAATLAKEANVHQLVITHFSQRYMSTDEHIRECESIHPQVIAADDGMKIDLPKINRELDIR